MEKRFSPRGSVESGPIALKGEAGFQPEVLRGGWHLLVPFMFRVHSVQLVTIAQGKIGTSSSRDGRPLRPDQALAEVASGSRGATEFRDALRSAVLKPNRPRANGDSSAS